MNHDNFERVKTILVKNFDNEDDDVQEDTELSSLMDDPRQLDTFLDMVNQEFDTKITKKMIDEMDQQTVGCLVEDLLKKAYRDDINPDY